MTLLQCENLAIGYQGHTLRSNIQFQVRQGDYLCIIGENGCGKSTLMKTILGLIPPISGSVQLETPKQIGYLPQQTASQKDFPASVTEIVLSGCLPSCGMRPFYNKADKEKAKAAMERLGLTPLAKRCYRELSGGQQERVLLARALCTSGKILLLDEPTSGLDPKITQELYLLLSSLNTQENISLIVISHDLKASFDHATHILTLGEEQFYGTKEAYLQWKQEERP